MSVYSRTPPEPTLRRGFCFSPFRNGSQPNVPGSVGTGDPDPGLHRQAKRGARRRERRGAQASRSTDGGADAYKVRFGGAPYSRASRRIRFAIFKTLVVKKSDTSHKGKPSYVPWSSPREGKRDAGSTRRETGSRMTAKRLRVRMFPSTHSKMPVVKRAVQARPFPGRNISFVPGGEEIGSFVLQTTTERSNPISSVPPERRARTCRSKSGGGEEICYFLKADG
jgi:hypothetical protein